MSSNKIRKSFNPYNVSLDEIREDEGKLELMLPASVLATSSANPSLLDVTIGFSRLILQLFGASDLVFSHWNIDTGIREASISVAELRAQKKLYVVLHWNKEEIMLFVGKQRGDPNLRKSRGDRKGSKVILGADGELRAIGDTGIYVLDFVERRGRKEVAGSDAAQMWESTVVRVNTLLEGFRLTDNFLFKLLLAQQCLVMLVTGFEVYAKERFSEIERFNIKQANTDELLRNFRDRYSDERRKFIEKGGTVLESILQVPEEQGIINFQNWEKCKLAYNKGYGITFGNLPVHGAVLRYLPDYFRYRHKIIHSKHISYLLNSDKPEEEPVSIYKDEVKEGEPQFIEKARNDFNEFINALHEATKKLA